VNLLLTQFADSSSGLGSLGIDGKAFVIQLVTFLLAFWVLKHWAFGPIIKLMEQRRQTIEDGVKLGEDMRKERAELEAQVEKKLHEARRQADGIIAEAEETGRETVREAETKAHDKAEGILVEAKRRTEQEVARARKQLESDIVSLISDATEAIIEEKVDAQKDAVLIDKALKEHARA
jgi:F-type H+-transporting ATPase subunit b